MSTKSAAIPLKPRVTRQSQKLPNPQPRPPWLKNTNLLAIHIGFAGILSYGVAYYIYQKEKRLREERKLSNLNGGANRVEQDATVPVVPVSPAEAPPQMSKDNISVFDGLAQTYDRAIGYDELVMGMGFLRNRLLSHAKGDVLEVAVGTGRNIKYYPDGEELTSVTFIDKSRAMLEQALQTFKEHELRFRRHYKISTSTDDRVEHLDQQNPSASIWNQLGSWFRSSVVQPPMKTRKMEIPSEFIRMDVGNLKSFKDNSFDTVIDSFGLCSVGPEYGPTPPPSTAVACGSHPVAVLNELARVCRPNGQVLLLEHGRASYDWLNRTLDRQSEKHFEKWGCHWNRDILDFIQQSDLEIVYLSRWHFGSTYYIIAQPKPSTKEVKEVTNEENK